MSNLNAQLHPKMLERHKGFDGINKPMGKKVFSIKLPVEYEQILINMSAKDRVTLIRGAIIDAIKQDMN